MLFHLNKSIVRKSDSISPIEMDVTVTAVD